MALWIKNFSVYGKRKLQMAARRDGLDIGREQTARIMGQLGIRGASRAKKRFTTRSDPAAPRSPDLMGRDFTATRPNEKWVADFTYCSTWSGIVYVAFVVDVFSRRIVGWKAARSMTTPLVLDALNMAAWSRRHADIEGVICHSDAGSQGGFNRSSQHLDHGGVRWDGTTWSCQARRRVPGGSGRRTGPCAHRCARPGGLSRRGQCCGSSGG